jgi:proline iminopeptidase
MFGSPFARGEAADAVTDEGTLDRDGFMLQWVREGSGIPMLVVGSQRYYHRLFPRHLRENFEIVFCDSRQWVATPDSYDITTITIETFTDDIEAARQATGLDKPIVAGHSQHGSLALEYARLHPDHTRGIAAVAAIPPVDSHDGMESAEEFFRRDAEADRLAAHERNHATRRVPKTVRTSRDFADEYVANDAMGWYDTSFDSSALWEGVALNLEVVYQLFSDKGLGAFRLERLDVPTFLALGRYDYLHPYYLWDTAKDRLSDLRYRLYQRSGHNPPYEQPAEFSADLDEWANNL